MRDVCENSCISQIKPNGIIYVQTDPQIAFERMKKRAISVRPSEKSLEQEYMVNLSRLYEKYIANEQKAGTPVLVIKNDGALDSAKIQKDIRAFIELNA